MHSIHVAITTYQRDKSLKRLIEQIHKEASKGLDIRLYVYSDDPESGVPEWWHGILSEECHYFPAYEHRGKRGFWRTINDILSDANLTSFDYFFLLQDDIELEDHFFRRMIGSWNCIHDKDKICLNPLMDGSRRGVPNWTGIDPKVVHGSYGTKFYRTGWVDCIFMSERRMLDALNWRINPIDDSRWKRNKFLSSGVGQQISKRLIAKDLHPYQVYESLVHHGGHESKMNPQERKQNPLIG